MGKKGANAVERDEVFDKTGVQKKEGSEPLKHQKTASVLLNDLGGERRATGTSVGIEKLFIQHRQEGINRGALTQPGTSTGGTWGAENEATRVLLEKEKKMPTKLEGVTLPLAQGDAEAEGGGLVQRRNRLIKH